MPFPYLTGQDRRPYGPVGSAEVSARAWPPARQHTRCSPARAPKSPVTA
ncbi:hypothetical protein [Nonomuraea maritima]